MKSQNKNNKLTFNKAAVTELNDNQLQDVNGGSAITISITITVTIITMR